MLVVGSIVGVDDGDLDGGMVDVGVFVVADMDGGKDGDFDGEGVRWFKRRSVSVSYKLLCLPLRNISLVPCCCTKSL